MWAEESEEELPEAMGPHSTPATLQDDAAVPPVLIKQPAKLKARLKEVPSEPGCYMLRDGEDRILYIGKAKALALS